MQFVIFHGSYGSPEGNWFPWLKTELENLGQEVIVPRFPVEKWEDVAEKGEGYQSKIQTLQKWMDVFEKEVLRKLDSSKQICFIGHSIGPVFILHLLERYTLPLDSAIFVSPFLQTLPMWEFNAVNDSFYKSTFDFKRLQQFVPVSYTLYGDNDPYVPLEQTLSFSEKMNSCKIIIKDGGHLNGKTGFTEFPLVLELCKTRLTS